MARLTGKDTSLALVYQFSKQYYKKQVDDKRKRVLLDIQSVRVTSRNNLEYDRENRQWVQTGREAKIVCRVRSSPVSYKKQDTIKIHSYPVVFLIQDVSKGMQSAFKWRTGSQKNVLHYRAGSSRTARNIANINIRNENQLHFFYNLEFVLARQGLLFGRNRAGWTPRKTNPKNLIYFDKSALACVEKIIYPFLEKGGSVAFNTTFK